MRLGADLPLEEQIGLDRLLDDAFAPGRRRHRSISAARVRARVAWDRPAEPTRLATGIALLSRMGQVPAALVLIAALAVGSSTGAESVQDGAPINGRDVIRGAVDEFRANRPAALPPPDPVDVFRGNRPGPVAVPDDLEPETAGGPLVDDATSEPNPGGPR